MIELEELEERLNEIERELKSMTDKEKAHIKAKQRDARERLERGQEVNLVVDELPADNSDRAVCFIDGLVTFLEPDGVELERADAVRARISDVHENAAHAILLERLEGEP